MFRTITEMECRNDYDQLFIDMTHGYREQSDHIASVHVVECLQKSENFLVEVRVQEWRVQLWVILDICEIISSFEVR